MITSFILSQVGEKQNELVFSSNPIDKQELSNFLYSVSGGLIDKKSFYRCFRMHQKIVMAYYWKVTYSEIKSGRHGLFVIIGFIVEDVLLPNYDSIIGSCRQFLCELQEVFGFSFSSSISDSFFAQLQLDTDDKMEKLKMRIANIVVPEAKLYSKKLCRKKNLILGQIPQAVYCLGESKDLTNWEIFFYEALHYIKQGYWDISSHMNTTPVVLRILNNGESFPINAVRVTLKRYQQCPYLLVF